jgi:broad specificity phosphatase PhoE
MSRRAVAAVRDWDARVTAGHGDDAVWLACSHGDVIKAIVADALGMHLDLFQRIAVDPASVTVIRYTPLRPFLLRANDTGGDLSGLRPPKRPRRARRRPLASDAQVGGGAGGGAGPLGNATTDRLGSQV